MSSRSGPPGDRFPRGLRVALAVSVALHVVAIAAMAINRASQLDLSPPPPIGKLVSPGELEGLEGIGPKPAAAPKPPQTEAAAKSVEAPKPPPEPPKPPEPVKPPAPSPEAIPIPEQKAPKPEKPKPEPPKPEKPKPEPPKPEKPKPEPPKPQKSEKPEKPDKPKPDDKAAKDKPAKPEQVAKAETKPADAAPARPTKADEESMEARLRDLAKKAEKAGVETGATWGIEGGTGKVPTEACQAALSQYGAEVIKKLRASVSYPDQLRGFSTRILLEIAKDGALVSGSVATSSGNRLFDDSVLAGVKKAAPFGPLPACWTDASFKGAIDFVAEEGAAG